MESIEHLRAPDVVASACAILHCTVLQPATTRYAYVYGVALHSYGDAGKAISVLRKALERSPADRDVLMALITFHRDMGDIRSAAAYADQLVRLSPGDTQAIALRNSLAQQKK